MFKGILIEKDEAGYRATIRSIDEADLPDGEVTVRISHSTLNYKDGLAITGKGPVVRRFPMVPGIDLVGTVESSVHPEFAVGDPVLLNGWGVGEGHWGGLAQKARLKGDWLVPLPKQFSPQQAMAIGTAGYTAMLCILALERHGITPAHGEILVSGAAGGTVAGNGLRHGASIARLCEPLCPWKESPSSLSTTETPLPGTSRMTSSATGRVWWSSRRQNAPRRMRKAWMALCCRRAPASRRKAKG